MEKISIHMYIYLHYIYKYIYIIYIYIYIYTLDKVGCEEGGKPVGIFPLIVTKSTSMYHLTDTDWREREAGGERRRWRDR